MESGPPQDQNRYQDGSTPPGGQRSSPWLWVIGVIAVAAVLVAVVAIVSATNDDAGTTVTVLRDQTVTAAPAPPSTVTVTVVPTVTRSIPSPTVTVEPPERTTSTTLTTP